MPNNLIQNIYDELSEVLPREWNKVIFYAEYGDASFGIEYYYTVGNSAMTKCFDQPGMTRQVLMKCFMKIDKILKKYRAELSDKQRWTNMTMVFFDSGETKVDFDYTDLSECAYKYKEQWRENYL